MSRIRTVDARHNNIDSIDPEFFDNSKQLTDFFLAGNSCSNSNFVIGSGNREATRQELDNCFRRFRFVRCQYSDTSPVACNMHIRNLFGIDDIEYVEGQLPLDRLQRQSRFKYIWKLDNYAKSHLQAVCKLV
jgi:hypothetical protein